MSREHFKGASYLFAKWMREAAEDIARGDRKGAQPRWRTPHPKVKLTWWQRQMEKTRRRA